MMLTDRLKNETHHEHLEVEKLIMPFIKNLSSVDEYVHLLHIFHGYFSPVEEQIAHHLSSEHIPDYNERRKSDALIKDAAILNGNLQAANFCINLPVINSTASALGALYVLEGSTLGGVHIKKMIENKLNGQAQQALNFFEGYGSNTMQRWNDFKHHLNRLAGSGVIEDEVVDAANDTFIKFKNWISQN